MVRLAYTCPQTGVIVIGQGISKKTVANSLEDTAIVQCPACQQEHHPKVRECGIFKSTSHDLSCVPLRAS
jgi:hypothetical protein